MLTERALFVPEETSQMVWHYFFLYLQVPIHNELRDNLQSTEGTQTFAGKRMSKLYSNIN